ncbi:hypothetical protein LY632_05330 [Erythrobacter sp. SDW2]|uniref:hypothetical protein n=1 Tax=Erythrobacter sp. SDW2 TaxID=2907154 RepID=UPI001F3EED45|nr:hypothetical protein [Erythrobacter sp. SDW2]UIP07823.1 hypothetical protein LY632_05330 [Erythrobacter sp. SDW2]
MIALQGDRVLRTLLGATAAIALLASGCGGDGSSPPPTSGTPSPSPTPSPTPTPTPSPTPTPTPAPTSTDPVLASLLSISQWKELFADSASYAERDLVEYNGALYFAFAAHAPHGVTPDADPAHFERLDLIPNQRLLLQDDFSTDGGPLAGRSVGPIKWVVSGPAFATALVDAARGYATADGNAYFMLLDIPGQISEFTADYFRDAPAGTSTLATISLSTNNFLGSGTIMWHANWSDTGVGNVRIWKDGQANLDPGNRFFYRTDVKLSAGREYRLTVRPRGAFAFGYVDSALAFISIADDNRIAAEAKALYVQNHVAVHGAEQHRYVELHVAN